MHQRGLPVVCIDTCVWLDFFRGRVAAKRARDELDALQQSMAKSFVVAIPDQVQIEYNRNKRAVLSEYAATLRNTSDSVEKYIEDFKEVASPTQISLRGDYEQHVLNRYVNYVDAAFCRCVVFKIEQVHYARGARRSCEIRAPAASKRGRSTADCVIIESFFPFVDMLRARGYKNNAYFLTSNTADFSDSQKSDEVHADLKGEFSRLGISYESVLPRFLNRNSF